SEYCRPDPRQPRLNDHLGPRRVDRVHDPLLRPTGPERGVRLAARRGGLAAVLRRALVLGLVLWIAVPSSAAADTLTLDAYRARPRVPGARSPALPPCWIGSVRGSPRL